MKLTDEQIEACEIGIAIDDFNHDFARAIESTVRQQYEQEIEALRQANLDCVAHYDAARADLDKSNELVRELVDKAGWVLTIFSSDEFRQERDPELWLQEFAETITRAQQWMESIE